MYVPVTVTYVAYSLSTHAGLKQLWRDLFMLKIRVLC
jgi:hypothetical protein